MMECMENLRSMKRYYEEKPDEYKMNSLKVEGRILNVKIQKTEVRPPLILDFN